jgi:hypothetical protein
MSPAAEHFMLCNYCISMGEIGHYDMISSIEIIFGWEERGQSTSGIICDISTELEQSLTG